MRRSGIPYLWLALASTLASCDSPEESHDALCNQAAVVFESAEADASAAVWRHWANADLISDHRMAVCALPGADTPSQRIFLRKAATDIGQEGCRLADVLEAEDVRLEKDQASFDALCP